MKILRTVAILVVALAILCVYSWVVKQASTGKKTLGSVGVRYWRLQKDPTNSKNYFDLLPVPIKKKKLAHSSNLS